MFWGSFWKHRKTLEAQYRDTNWEEASGQSQEALEEEAVALTQRLTAERLPKPLIKARLFAYALDHAQLAVVPEELFQDHIRHGFVVQKQRATWEQEVNQHALAGVVAACASMYAAGAYQAINDFGHTVPDWYDVLRLGYPGLLARVRLARQTRQVAGTLTAEQTIFYDASILTYEAVLRYLQRMGNLCADKADAFDGEDGERLRYCAAELHALAEHAPQTLHQALQATFLFHILQEEMEGERLRSLGGLDREFAKFQQRETADGTLTDAQTVELWQDFFQKFHALTGDALFGEPMYLGGTLADGSCAVNDTTYTILHAYDSLQIANPKFHIRIASDTPARFLREVLDCIRRGNSSFVFVSDDCAIPMMQRLGVPVEEAREYVPVGCYEPGILGREVACTGNGGVSMPKAVELALNDGMDGLTGQQIGPHTGKPECFATFAMLCDAVKAQLAHLMQCMMRNVCALEVHYMEINPSPLFSATMRECVEAGVDAYAGGAKYNNSSLYLYGNGTMADELAMIKKWVYQRQTLTLPALVGILQNNWEGQELLRMRMKHDPDKWGNNRSL
ncbi:MAG: pyruvate formate lyase family protein, partial [Clostridia bacterium]